MSNFISTFKNYFLLLLEPIIALLIGILTVLVTKNSNTYNAARERLNNAYHPIFIIAEPYLFKSIDITFAKYFIDEYYKIENLYSLYIYPSLRLRVDLLSKIIANDYNQSKADEHWKLICQYLNKDYDNLCRKAHMPLRSTSYRMNYKQFSDKFSLYWEKFLSFRPYLILIIFYVILVILFINRLNSLVD